MDATMLTVVGTGIALFAALWRVQGRLTPAAGSTRWTGACRNGSRRRTSGSTR